MPVSETAPHTAVSTDTHRTLLALAKLTAVAAVEPEAIPFVSIAVWGPGPTGAYSTGFFARVFVDVATALFRPRLPTEFWPILILPPILDDGEKTDAYRSGEASMMKDAMGVTNFVSRASMADLRLKLGKRWHRARRCRNGSASPTPSHPHRLDSEM